MATMTKKELKETLLKIRNEETSNFLLSELSQKTGIDFRTLRELSYILNDVDEKLSEEEFDLLTNPQTYTVNNCIYLYENGLEGLIPTKMYENHNFIQGANVRELPISFAAGNANLTSFTLCAEIEEIGEGAFMECVFLEDFFIEPNSKLKVIGNYSFYLTQMLTEICLPENLELIKANAFFLSTIHEIILPKSLAAIELNAFGSCKKLKSVTFLGCTQVGEYAFSSCKKLEKVTGPFTIVGKRAFSFCSHLEEINIDGTYIPEETFRECTNLQRVTLSNRVKEIDKTSFDGCEIDTIEYYGFHYQMANIDDFEKTIKCSPNKINLIEKMHLHDVISALR